MSFGKKTSNVKLIRTSVGKGKILKRFGDDKRVILWKDEKGKEHVGTRVRQRSHK